MYNRNKQSLCIDLKSQEGHKVTQQFVEQVDALIEDFRPRVLEKLGFGTLTEINPRLVYCSLKGFLSGPYENRTALDEVTQMMGGLVYMTGPPDQPFRTSYITGGMFGVIGILAALEQRHSSGVGQLIIRNHRLSSGPTYDTASCLRRSSANHACAPQRLVNLRHFSRWRWRTRFCRRGERHTLKRILPRV